MKGSLRNSIGDTIMAGAKLKALVIQKCAHNPQKPIIITQNMIILFMELMKK